ncbi:phage tail fiber domain-containing protein [Rahnella sp. PCH160]|uniref:phage tail fiber domain-containing protein n=1 Tax=Rahnella sp. PCH160 TaxID=3447928 RepID=UPI0039FC9442
MTVSTEVNQAAYTGNGVTTVFPYTFRILNSANLTVTRIDLLEVETVLTLGTDYTVTGAGSYNGGSVVLPQALPSGYSLVIERDLAAIQDTDLRNQGTFFAEVHEDAFDYLTMLVQQVTSWIGLALRRPTIKSNFYDAKQYRIANLADPASEQDAVNNRYMKSYVDRAISGVIGGFGWFIQAGSGAVYRTFQDKMRDSVSLLDFGTDTTALTRAIATGKTVRIPAGNYSFICNTINLPSNTQLLFDSAAVINWVNNSGSSGSSQEAWCFKCTGVNNIVISGGTHNYANDTIVLVAVQSATSNVMIEYMRVIGPRLLNVQDGTGVYGSSTSSTRSKNINVRFITGQVVTRSSTGAFICIRFTDGGVVSDVNAYGYYYAGMFWGGDSNFSIDGAMGNERKCTGITFKNVVASVVWAGVWGSMGHNITIENCSVTAIDPSHSDVGIDFEGCTNSRAYGCYAKNFPNGCLATFFYNSQVSFINCDTVVDNALGRHARFNNSGQNNNARDILIEGCRFKSIGFVSLINQNGAAHNLIFKGNSLVNVMVLFIANNNGYIEVSGNQFSFDVVPSNNYNTYGVYAMLGVGGFHGGLTGIGAGSSAKSLCKDNWFSSEITLPSPSYATWILNVSTSKTTNIDVIGGGTLSTGVDHDLGLANVGANVGISLRFDVRDYQFFNSSWTTEILGSATLYPKGTVKGKNNLGVVWPNSITDNLSYASTWYDVRQEFELITPTSTKRGDLVYTAGIGTSAAVRDY